MPNDRIKFAESGAGEMLYMICSAIKIRRAKTAISGAENAVKIN